MKRPKLHRLMQAIARLSWRQRRVLQVQLAALQARQASIETIESQAPGFCPHCGAAHIVKNGFARGLQRFLCRGCTCTFNALTGAPLSGLHQRGKWLAHTQALSQGLSIPRVAERLEVAWSTAFRWRHRFLQLPSQRQASALRGIAEADESYFLESSKGQRALLRQARRRGGKASQRGVSKEQVSVLMVRDKDGSIHVVENVCAHRGMAFCRERHGNRESLTCPYHQWNYTLSGDLQGVPFRRGVKQDGKVNGGMPADFNPAEHGLTKLKVATRGGVVFASFDHSVEPLEEFLGPTILGYFDRLFNGRKLTILGYNRQRIPGNWKLMQENIKDPYHPGLLHTWFVTFGLWRADNKAALKMDAHHRHAAMISTRGNAGKQSDVSQVSSFKSSMELEDKRFLDIVHEDWWGEPTAVMTTMVTRRTIRCSPTSSRK